MEEGNDLLDHTVMPGNGNVFKMEKGLSK